MKLFFRCLLLLSAAHLSVSAQTALPKTSSSSKPDPVHERLAASRPDFANPATRRLEVLAQIWGQIALHHPVPSANRLRWDDVLASAVGGLATVRTEEQFAALLNREVFAPLHDPLAYATTIAAERIPVVYSPPLAARWLAPGVAYVSAVNRAFAAPPFANQLRGLIDSLGKTGDLQRLVVDLRSSSRGSYREGLPTTWLGMWTGNAIVMGQPLSVFRDANVWDLSEVKWLVSPRPTLVPLAPQLTIPTVFLVNRTSYPVAERALDAVRSLRNDIAVVFEESGPIPYLSYNVSQTWFPDSILLPHFRIPIVSADGGLGSIVDLTLDRSATFDSMPAIANRALNARRSRMARPTFLFEDARIRDDTVSMAPLTREQRIAGLLKVWFWVGQ